MSITEHDFLPQEPSSAGTSTGTATSASTGAGTGTATSTATATAARHDRTTRTLASLQGIQGYAQAMAFLTELDSQTWVARYTAAERLGDPGAVSSPAAYAAWLRRVGAAWSAVPMPSVAQAGAHWPFSALSPLALDASGQIDADLRELALASGGSGRTAVTTKAGSLTALAAQEDLDAAYVAGAAYVAVTTAQEVAVLAADVEHLSSSVCRTPLPQHYVRHCAQVSAVRSIVRRELAEWAEQAGPDAAERVVLAARMLVEHLATALSATGRLGW